MPLLKIQTNLDLARPIQEEITRGCSTLLSQLLNKPERYIMVILECEVNLIFDGKATSACYLELKSIGLPEKQTADFSAALTQYLMEKTGTSANRIYIEFSNSARHLWGWNGSTF